MATAPSANSPAVHGIARHKPAQPAHFARAGGVQHRTRAEKQQRLEQTVVPDMQQPARQRQPPPGGIALRRAPPARSPDR